MKTLHIISQQVFKPVILLVLSFTVFLFYVRCYEYMVVDNLSGWQISDLFHYSLPLDLLTSTQIGLILLVILLISFSLKKQCKWCETFIWSISSTLTVILTLFYLSSGRLLGEEIFSYDIIEAVFITKSSLTLSTYITAFALTIGNVILFKFSNTFKNSKAYKSNVFSYISFVFCILIIIVWNNNKNHLYKTKDLHHFINIEQYFVANSKIPYFISAIHYHLLRPSQIEYSEEQITTHSKNYISRNSLHNSTKHPFLSSTIGSSSISRYFKSSSIPPNFVFILTESLSSSFSGTSNYLGSHTPFLDSLSKHSLSWVNMISCADRTYGVLPNVLGSLPFGRNEKGFINDDNLKNISQNTITSLYPETYTSNFFYPGWADFDHMADFMKINQTRKIIAEQEIKLLYPSKKKFKWGYDDQTLFDSRHRIIKKDKKPFIDIFLTLGIHNPYDQEPEESTTALYLKKKNIRNTKIKNKKIRTAIFLTDDAIKSYFQEIKNKPSFQNTIFIITGDHNIGPELRLKSPIETFRVPLIIFSPLLNTSKQFKSIVTHRDILPTLVGLLSENFNLQSQKKMVITSQQLDTVSYFRSKVATSLKLYSKVIPSYIEGDYYLLNEEVYFIEDSLMNSSKVNNDSIKALLLLRINERKILNNYTIGHNLLTP